MRLVFPFALLLFATACDSGSTDVGAEAPAFMPPATLCKQSSEALRQLEKGAAFARNAPDAVTIPREVWLGLAPRKRDAVVTAVAIDAVCASGEPASEREVVVRDEGGLTLARRAIDTSFNPLATR